jgi:hypothetical protein
MGWSFVRWPSDTVEGGMELLTEGATYSQGRIYTPGHPVRGPGLDPYNSI